MVLFEDQLDELAATWPTANLSDVVRSLLDRMFEKARNQSQSRVKGETPNALDD